MVVHLSKCGKVVIDVISTILLLNGAAAGQIPDVCSVC